MPPRTQQGQALARTNGGPAAVQRPPPPPIPIAPGLMPDAEQMGRLALAVIGDGNLDQMTDVEKTRFVIRASQMLGLNPIMSPFLIVKFEGRAVLYLTKAGAEQLAGLHGVSTEVTSKAVEYGLYTMTVRARQGGRFADATGAVPFETPSGELIPIAQRARVIKIAETQARRRSILALIGLGFLDRPGMTDPDQVMDRHGNVATREQRELPASRSSNADIWDDELPRGAVVETPRVAEAAVAEQQATSVTTEERASGNVTHAEPTPPTDDEPDIWEEAKKQPPREATGPRWADTPLGRDVSAMVDQLTEMGLRFQLPPDDASDMELKGWLASKTTAIRNRA